MLRLRLLWMQANLKLNTAYAPVAESEDAADLKSVEP